MVLSNGLSGYKLVLLSERLGGLETRETEDASTHNTQVKLERRHVSYHWLDADTCDFDRRVLERQLQGKK